MMFAHLFQHKYVPVSILFLTLGLSFFYHLNSAPLFDRDEGFFSEVTREMFERRDFISSYLNGIPRYDKPILFYWFQALGILLFGLCERAFRLPSAIAATCWVLAVYGFAKRYVDRQTGWVAGMFMATSLWVLIIGRAATADALVNLFMTLSLFDIYRYFQTDMASYRHRVFIWTALGLLTKGPIAVLIPFGVSMVFFISQRQWRRWLKPVFHPMGILILLSVTLPWYLAQYLKEGYPFIAGFFLTHNIGRYVAPMDGHSGGICYYILAVFLVVFPYSTLLLLIFRRLPDSRKHPFDLFLWIWFLFVFIFFSFSATKLPHYILHGSPPLFILMAKYRHDLRSRLFALFPALTFLICLLFLPEIIEFVRVYLDDVYITAILRDATSAFELPYRLWTTAALMAVLVLMLVKRSVAWQSLIIAGMLYTFLFGHLWFPLAGTVIQGPVKEAALYTKQQKGYVVMWRIDAPSFLVYRRQITPNRLPRPGEIVFTRVDRIQQFNSYRMLYQQGGVVLAFVEGEQ